MYDYLSYISHGFNLLKDCNCFIELRFPCILLIFSTHFFFLWVPPKGDYFPYDRSTVFGISFHDKVLVANLSIFVCLFTYVLISPSFLKDMFSLIYNFRIMVVSLL